MADDMFRLVTRSDFDGLVSAVLLKELGLIDRIWFVHPKDVQDGKIDVSSGDITTNLPYVKNAHYTFDHHKSEIERVGSGMGNHIIDPDAPSAARVVYNSFGGAERFANVTEEMMEAVDKADSAQYTKEEILSPTGWTLLNFIMDARTGLGRFHGFRISNYQLMMELIDSCLTHTIEEILELPDVKERVDVYFKHKEKFKEQLEKCTTVYDNLGIIDLRNEDIIYTGNRFIVYAMYPQINISMHVMWGKNKQNIVFATGHSVLNRTSNTDVGSLMLKYNGGGHKAAGTCQVEIDEAEKVKKELIEIITVDG